MLIADTDGDGFSDGKEDSNGNGRLDRGETDPLDPEDPDLVACDSNADCELELGPDYLCDGDVCVEQPVNNDSDAGNGQDTESAAATIVSVSGGGGCLCATSSPIASVPWFEGATLLVLLGLWRIRRQ
jgi:MYXO-CTERM domain-containing protein